MTVSRDAYAHSAESPQELKVLEERILELQTNLASVTAQNERLVATLREARDQIAALKEEVDRLAQPPPASAPSSPGTRTAPRTSSPAAANCASTSVQASSSTNCAAARK